MLQCLRKTIWHQFLKILHDTMILLLGNYLKGLKAGTRTENCTPMFMATFFTIATKWKKHKCSTKDEYTGEELGRWKSRRIVSSPSPTFTSRYHPHPSK